MISDTEQAKNNLSEQKNTLAVTAPIITPNIDNKSKEPTVTVKDEKSLQINNLNNSSISKNSVVSKKQQYDDNEDDDDEKALSVQTQLIAVDSTDNRAQNNMKAPLRSSSPQTKHKIYVNSQIEPENLFATKRSISNQEYLEQQHQEYIKITGSTSKFKNLEKKEKETQEKQFKKKAKTSKKQKKLKKDEFASADKPQSNPQENQIKDQMRSSLSKKIAKDKKKLKKDLEELKKKQEDIEEDDGYLDDIMDYEEENWNQIDMRDEMIASLVSQQRDKKQSKMMQLAARSSIQKKKLVEKEGKKSPSNKNYDFQRLKQSIERQNYMQMAKCFDSTLRLNFDEVKTLNGYKKEYNPYPDYNEPLANKGFKYLTLENPQASIIINSAAKSRSVIFDETKIQSGRICPKIPRIDNQLDQSARPIFMIRRPLSTRYNQDRKKYLSRNFSRGQLYSKDENQLQASSVQTQKKKARKLQKLVGFELFDNLNENYGPKTGKASNKASTKVSF